MLFGLSVLLSSYIPSSQPGSLQTLFYHLLTCSISDEKYNASLILLLFCKYYLESPLDCKEIQPVHSEGDQPWDFFGRNDAKAETPVLWSPHAKSWLTGKDFDAGRDWGQEEKGTAQDEMAGWHHGLDRRESEWTPEVGDGQGGLACCYSWGPKSQTRLSDWTELNWSLVCLEVC